MSPEKPDNGSDKNSLRKRINRQRRDLDRTDRTQAATRLCENLLQTADFRKARHVACYLAVNGEMSLSPVIELCEMLGKQVYLPVLHPFLPRRLWFAPYKTGATMINNRYGIPEPLHHPGDCIDPRTLDLVLMPLVAFDHKGHRLGMGGGYYDRSFAFMSTFSHWHHTRLFGIAYELQKVSSLKRENWDVPLHSVITENKIYCP